MEIVTYNDHETVDAITKLKNAVIRFKPDDEGGFISFYIASFASVASQIEDIFAPEGVQFQFALNGFIDRIDLELDVVNITKDSILLGAAVTTSRLAGSGISGELYDSENVSDIAFRVPLNKLDLHIHDLLGVDSRKIDKFYLAKEPVDIITKFYTIQEKLGGVETQEAVNSQLKELIESMENGLAEKLLG